MSRITRLVALATLICCAGPAASARAGIWVQVTGTALDSREDSGASETGGSSTLASLSAGYRFNEGFLLGVQGFMDRETGVDGSTWAVGPKGGFFLKGIEVTAAYLPIANSSRLGINRSGGGFAINVGYNAALSRVFHVGIYGTYWSNTYDKADGADVFPRPTAKYIAPQLALGFEF